MNYSQDTHLVYDEVVSELERGNRDMDIKLIDKWFPVTDLDCYTFLGSFAWTSKAAKRKWIISSAAEQVGQGWYTPADLARGWLKVKHPKKLRCNKVQWAEMQKKRSAPLYAKPGYLPEAVYVDLQSAYWSILKKSGWDIDYMPGRYAGVKSSAWSFPFAHNKMARNCLVSVGRSGGMSVWTGKKLAFIQKPNRFANGVLFMFVMDILNGIAADMVRAGAIYVHTDGYIIDPVHLPLVDEIMGSWGMPWGIKNSGPAIVYGAATYDIGHRKHKKTRILKPTGIDSIHPVQPEWLKSRFRDMGYKPRGTSTQVPG